MKRNYIKIGVLILLIPIVAVLGAELIALVIKNAFETEITNNLLVITRVVRYITIPIIVLIFPVSSVLVVYGLLNKRKTS